MNSILSNVSEITPDSRAGGKACALAELDRAGFRVPEFFVALPDASEESILAAFNESFANGSTKTPVAVRSSAVGEDSAEHSFAGQFESYLNIEPGDLLNRVHDVWKSGAGERARAYGEERGTAVEKPAAIIQRMIDPEIAGVAFSADPVSGRRNVAVISAVRGLGEQLVSGEADGESTEVSRDQIVSAISTGGKAPEFLTDKISREVAALARDCAAHFGQPQDIEWVIDREGRLWLLQSRPITSLAGMADPDAPLFIWDNSNIAESYSGVTTPLTFSFARRAYENVYREFCRLMSVPRARIEASDDTFRAMIGLIRGRVYYNLISWYRVLALLPGFRANRAFMEQMMGVKEPMPEAVVAEIEADHSIGPWRDRLHLGRTFAALLTRLAALPKSIRHFYHRLEEALSANEIPIEQMEPGELAAHYRDLESRLLKRWDAPLVNDFFAMIFCGVLRKLCDKWLGSEALSNEYLSDIGDIISAEPARRIRSMAESLAAGNSIDGDLENYIADFGDRCIEELKLESPTLRDDSSTLRQSIEALAERIRSGTAVRSDPQSSANNGDPGNQLPWPRRVLFRWVLNQARGRVRDRENLRFERTRLFGRVRQIMRRFGEHLATDGVLESADDVFYLELEEVLGHFDGTAAKPIRPDAIAGRCNDFEAFRNEEPPPDRFNSVGSPNQPGSIVPSIPSIEPSPADSDSSSFTGIGACAGKVRGRVRVVRDPRNATLESGDILVAQQTDPGWVILFPAAAGLLVERGSLLSHSAIVAREMGIPAIVSIPNLMNRLADGLEVEMDGATGAVTIVKTD